ncbi:hypothetical protein G6F50_015776 [Rhizopus delemar]|uniref:Uncharacterized protein n=1 Tax=Rhizopus delemar TaxID=936053 RepID=A0A9P6XWX3_9FUNG|nr:hypothetical protein G6F50_015776 [Rhizopus delemar]
MTAWRPAGQCIAGARCRARDPRQRWRLRGNAVPRDGRAGRAWPSLCGGAVPAALGPGQGPAPGRHCRCSAEAGAHELRAPPGRQPGGRPGHLQGAQRSDPLQPTRIRLPCPAFALRAAVASGLLHGAGRHS